MSQGNDLIPPFSPLGVCPLRAATPHSLMREVNVSQARPQSSPAASIHTHKTHNATLSGRMMDDPRSLLRPDQMAVAIEGSIRRSFRLQRRPSHSPVTPRSLSAHLMSREGRVTCLIWPPALRGRARTKGPWPRRDHSAPWRFCPPLPGDSASPVSAKWATVSPLKKAGESPLSEENRGVIE